EGRNLKIEYRWGQNDAARLPELVADLVRRQVAVIATLSTMSAARAAKALTTTIPIVFEAGSDPADAGLVASPLQPGGNVTGFPSMNSELASKQLGLLRELLPTSTHFAVFANPNNVNAKAVTEQAEATATATGLEVEIVAASTTAEIDAAFSSFAQKPPNA